MAVNAAVYQFQLFDSTKVELIKECSNDIEIYGNSQNNSVSKTTRYFEWPDSFQLAQRFLFFTTIRTVLSLKYCYVLRSKAVALTECIRVPYLRTKFAEKTQILSQQKSLSLLTGRHLLCV